MTKEKLKAVMVLTIAAVILLAVLVFTGLIIVLAFPILILLGTLLVGWGIKVGIEWLMKNINYKQVANKTVEHGRIFAEKIKIDEGKKIIKDSIDELRKK